MPPTVLIVEDDADIRSLFEAGVSAHGYAVETASNGRDALAMMERMALLPSVIVCDLHMPVMDGWQLLTALAEMPRLASIPVIVLTAADDPSKRAPRPTMMLIKPVALGDLLTAIEAAARSNQM